MATVDEIAQDVFRISVFDSQGGFHFNHFLVRDEEPLLFHLGTNGMFEEIRQGVASVLDPASLRWLAFSHFEADECGSLNRWLGLAPRAEPACTMLASQLSVTDVALRAPRDLGDGDVIETGRHRLRCLFTPHVPHNWDAGMLFDETDKTLFCSDLFFHFGKTDALIESDIVGRNRDALRGMDGTPYDHSTPWTSQTPGVLSRLADLRPRTLAVMHGACYRGDGAAALTELSGVMQEILA